MTTKTIGIVGAMDSEIDAIKALLSSPVSTTVSGVEYISGTYGHNTIVAAKSGVGKVFAAICVQTMILTFHPDMVLHIGVAGGLSPALHIGDIAIADATVQHDMDTTPIGDPLGLISGINKVYLPCDETMVSGLQACGEELGLNCRTGVIASGDCFVSSSAKKAHIVENFSAIACEMEGAATGHVCYVNNIPCGVIRGISDAGDESAGTDYMVSLAKAADAVFRLVKRWLDTL